MGPSAALHDATVRGDAAVLGALHYVSAVSHNGAGRYSDALIDAREARDETGAFVGWALAELVEAAIHTGRRDEARSALELLTEQVHRVGTDLAYGVLARSEAIVCDGPGAEHGFLEAIDRLRGERADLFRARAHLSYGEWLRRQHRRIDSREQLRQACDIFYAVGAERFAERTRRELPASSEATLTSAAEDLTPQEAAVTRLVSEGRTNAEIGEELFISPRTVEYHLRKVFVKLGVTSRRQLRPLMTASSSSR